MLKELFKLIGTIIAGVIAFTAVSILVIIALVYMIVDIMGKL